MPLETAELINTFLQLQLEPISFLDIFIQYISPLIQLLVILGGAIAGLYKYYKTKNREIYEKLLSEVYAPLYQYLVKQELYRKIVDNTLDYKSSPILELTSKETVFNDTSVKITTSPVLGLNRDELLKVLDSINIGLASKELYTLLSMYKVLIHIENSTKKTRDDVLTASIMKVDIENKLRKEIVSGYKKYHNKLGVKAGGDMDFFTLSEDQIIFNISVSDEEKQQLKEKIEKNPDKY